MKYISVLPALLITITLWAQSPRIVFEAPKLYPEGVAFNTAANVFYVSSVKTGTIGTVDLNGKYKSLYQDKTLKSTFGMKVDSKQNRLWVCSGDPNYSMYSDSATFKKMIRLIGIDLTTGKKVADIDLSKLYTGKHFANDLTLDDKSNIYITDSFSPVIYKVDAQGKPTVFAQSSLFAGVDVGLNGIVYHPKGFLLVANDRDGAIIKVDIKDPSKITRVKTRTLFPGVDGLLFDAQNNLVLIQNKGINKATQLASTDNWLTADVKLSTLAEDRFQHPTTGALKDGQIYLLNSKMNELMDSTLNPSKQFSLQLVNFKPAQ